jgi:hypothetical protein
MSDTDKQTNIKFDIESSDEEIDVIVGDSLFGC